jgi:hypothetical protein
VNGREEAVFVKRRGSVIGEMPSGDSHLFSFYTPSCRHYSQLFAYVQIEGRLIQCMLFSSSTLFCD